MMEKYSKIFVIALSTIGLMYGLYLKFNHKSDADAYLLTAGIVLMAIILKYLLDLLKKTNKV